MLSVIVPASNEAEYIIPCLKALFASEPVPGGAEVVVVANGCHDDTADRARAMHKAAEAAGWRLTVVDMAEGGKIPALNAGDAAATGDTRAYLDADVRVSPPLMAQIVLALDHREARYATGRPVVAPAQSGVTRAYARFWARLPFAAGPAPGFGLFCVNAQGRTRWGPFPPVISDDTYVRLLFRPDERVECPATYVWPMVEGFAALVRVRRRQDAGVAEVAQRYPGLMLNGSRVRPALLKLMLADPVGFLVYGAVSVTVRLGGRSQEWVRGR